MITLKLNLFPIDRIKFQISADKYGSEESKLPFSDGDADPNLFTILNALNALDRRYKSSKSDDKNWMLQEGLLVKDNKRFFYASEMHKKIGIKLYNALFTGEIKEALLEALGKASSTETQERLHIQLQYEADAIQTSNLPLYPWQLVHNEQDFLAKRRVIFSYLIAHRNSLPKGKRSVEQMKVLLISSTAFENDNQRIQSQELAIRQGLRKAELENSACLLSWYQPPKKPTCERLRDYLTNHRNESSKRPDIIHFNGHGYFKRRCYTPSCLKDHSNEVIYPKNVNKCKICKVPLNKPEGFLLFEDDNAQSNYINAEAFANLVSISKPAPALVVITACKSALAYESDSVFNGIAQKLLLDVSAVVATPFNISEDSVTRFIEQFYRALGAKQSLLEAVTLASNAMRYYDYEWYRPVIFMRYDGNEDGYLFEFDDSSETKSEKKSDEQQQATLNIPANIPHSGIIEDQFFGRDEELKKLQKLFQDKNIVAITGMGGVGKTELAIQYANHHYKQQTYEGGVCWVQMEEDENQEDSNLGFGEMLLFAKSELNLQPPPSDLKSQIKYCWKYWLEGNVLLVVDNVTKKNFEKIVHYLPPTTDKRFKVLITTRDKLGSPTVPLDLNVLSQEAGLDILNSLVGKRVQDDLKVAKELCQWLDNLPLGLELVGRYLSIDESLSLAKMQERLKNQRLESKVLLKRQVMTAQRGIVDAFELSWKRLDENQKFLGYLLSLFSSSPIPWLLVEKVESAGKVEESTDLEEARHTLIEFSLIKKSDKESDDNAYQLHPLIREFFKDKLKLLETKVNEEYKRNFCQAIAEVAREIPQRLTIKKILEVEQSIQHIQEATEEALNKYLSDENIIQPFIGLGRYYEGQGLYSEAEKWYNKCLSTTEERLKEVCSDVVKSQVVKSQNALADLYLFLKRDQDAELRYRKALKIGKKLRKQKPYDKDKQYALDVAKSQADLGYLYSLQKRYWRAKPLLESALKIRNEYPENHSEIVESLNYLAYFYRVQEDWDNAQKLYEKALQRSENFSNDEDENLLIAAECYHNLATFYHSRENYDKAEDGYHQALKLNQQLQGQENLEAAHILSTLANLYKDKKDYKKAEEHYLNALDIRNKLLKKHLNIAENLRKLGYLFYDQQRYSEAISWFYKTLEMIKDLIDDKEPSASNNKDKLVKWIYGILCSLEDLVHKSKRQDVVFQWGKIAKFDEKQTLPLPTISDEIIAPVLKLLGCDK
ncbi:CHAT domain-containing tetratricopeptide repeat protein [Nostoc favosum]|uniref:Tetratricopeptide repeat protein n=1 Tax=Nostoc favosum CHAB5714 TaxID=2780399 RepID=A0ABS8I5T0_9NOSO|nr:tetratricopeptide repeat protein [Nostoc favosum]MCC5599417.1 tetratricopeptide repeat protein [Nostoc favosum CHAB5714]